MTIDTKALKLKVSEALSKDVGRAYARMGPEDLARLRRRGGRHRGSGRQDQSRLQGDAGLQGDARPVPDSTGWTHAGECRGRT